MPKKECSYWDDLNWDGKAPEKYRFPLYKKGDKVVVLSYRGSHFWENPTGEETQSIFTSKIQIGNYIERYNLFETVIISEPMDEREGWCYEVEGTDGYISQSDIFSDKEEARTRGIEKLNWELERYQKRLSFRMRVRQSLYKLT